MSIEFSERSIAGYLARYVFQGRHLVVPNCQWPGSECDLLVVTANLRVIDVEIKISRSDLRADARKAKWFHSWDFRIDGPWVVKDDRVCRPRQWPARCWKHYYALPRAIWMPELVDDINPTSGILLVSEYHGRMQIAVERAAKPDRKAEKISAEDAVDIARLASLRMWSAFEKLDAAEARQQRLAA